MLWAVMPTGWTKRFPTSNGHHRPPAFSLWQDEGMDNPRDRELRTALDQPLNVPTSAVAEGVTATGHAARATLDVRSHGEGLDFFDVTLTLFIEAAGTWLPVYTAAFRGDGQRHLLVACNPDDRRWTRMDLTRERCALEGFFQRCEEERLTDLREAWKACARAQQFQRELPHGAHSEGRGSKPRL